MPAMPNGRRLDRKVSLQRAVRTENELYEAEDAWATIATVPAAYHPLSDGERLRAAEVAAAIDARFVVRWSASAAALTAKDRLIFEGRVFNIAGVKDVADSDGRAVRRRWIEISGQARAS